MKERAARRNGERPGGLGCAHRVIATTCFN
jgi:hypothetical protein